MEVCEDPDPKVISPYSKLTRFYLLFRDNREENEYINILFKNSKFYAPSTPCSPSVSVIFKQQVEPVSFEKKMERTISEIRFSTFSSTVKPHNVIQMSKRKTKMGVPQ